MGEERERRADGAFHSALGRAMTLKRFLAQEVGAIRQIDDRGYHQSKTVVVDGEKRSVVLRLSKNPFPIETNYYALRRASAQGVSPKALALFSEEGLFSSVESFVSGRAAVKEDIALIKAALLKLYKVKKKSSVSWKSVFFQREGAFLRKSPWYSLIEEQFPDIQTTQMIHGDMSLPNMIVSDEGVIFIDFQKAFFGEPEYDLGRLFWYEGLFLEGPWNPEKILFYAFLFGARWQLIHPEGGREEELLELKSRLFP